MRIPSMVLAAAAVIGGCGEPLPPIARIELVPRYLCEGEPDQDVSIDGRGSRAWDGGDPQGLRYLWSFSAAPLEVVSGSVTDARLTARFAAVRPVRVRLDLEDEAGVSASQVETVGLTRTVLTACGGGCQPHEECATVGGRRMCVDQRPCGGGEDCGPCLRCEADDEGVRRCIP